MSKETCKELNVTEEQLKDKQVFDFLNQYIKRQESGRWIQRLNGNVIVEIDKHNGTLISTCLEDEMNYEVPCNVDCKITNRCHYNCSFCHEQSTPDGNHGDLFNENFQKVLSTFPVGTEIALGGGAVTTHPDLYKFLSKLKEYGILANITVKLEEFLSNKGTITKWMNERLVNGVGVSINPDSSWGMARNHSYIHPNIVFHTIAGIWSLEDYKNIADKDIKVLILGYKDFGRGKDFRSPQITRNLDDLRVDVDKLFNMFKVLSFDNLALNQLQPKDKLSKEVWDSFYQGTDSSKTMYFDAVEMTFAGHSTTPKDKRFSLLDYNNIKDVFNKVKGTVQEGL